jgi:hypothetical protein
VVTRLYTTGRAPVLTTASFARRKRVAQDTEEVTPWPTVRRRLRLPPGLTGSPVTRRWTEQRWLLDNTIRSVGMDWDQPRSIYLSSPCGPEASADFDIYFSMRSWIDTGPAVVDWLTARSEIDHQRIGLSGNSFGSFFGTIAAAHEPRIRAVSVSAVCHEPGFHTIFEEASPTFKMRFMYMSGITDEAEFDDVCQSMTWEGHAEKIRAPYLCLAGEFDELSPLEHTERLMRVLPGPKRLVVYQDSRHSVGNVPAANLGPFPPVLMADWMAATLAGQSFPSEKWYVEASGRVVKTPWVER